MVDGRDDVAAVERIPDVEEVVDRVDAVIDEQRRDREEIMEVGKGSQERPQIDGANVPQADVAVPADPVLCWL